MEPPFLVFRDRTARGVEVITSIPLPELLHMYAAARELIRLSYAGTPEEKTKARASVETVLEMAIATPPETRGRLAVSAYLVREAMNEIPRAEAPAAAPPASAAPAQGAPTPENYEARARAQYEAAVAKKKQEGASP